MRDPHLHYPFLLPIKQKGEIKMPDDEKATEQEPKETEEKAPDEEGELAFAEDMSEEEEPSEKGKEKAESKSKEDEEEKKKPEKKAKKEPREESEEQKAEEKKKEKELTVEEKIKERIKNLEDEEEEIEEKSPEEKPEKKKPEEEKEKKPEEKAEEGSKPAKLNKELLAERLSLISKDDLPGEVIIGDETVNLKQYAEDYPDDFAAIRVLSSLVAEKMINKTVEGIEIPDTGKVTERVDNLEAGLAQLSFDNGVMRAKDDEGNLKHSDYYDIVYGSGMKDFHAWIKEQSPKVQKLASSLNPEDGILVLDYYKENIARRKTTEHDKKTKDKKREYDDIYKSEKTMRKNQPESSIGGKSPDKEAEEAFEEED